MARRKGPTLTRADVVKAAVDVVQTDGADALGVSRVARELGIKPPSIYNHVGTGDALARAVVVEATLGLVTAYEDAVRGVLDPTEQLRALANTMRTWTHAHRGLYVLMARTEPENDHPVLGPIVRDMLDLFAQPLGRLGVPEDERIHAIRALRSAIHGFVMLELGGQFQLREDVEASYRWMVELMIRGATVEG